MERVPGHVVLARMEEAHPLGSERERRKSLWFLAMGNCVWKATEYEMKLDQEMVLKVC